MDRIKQQNAEKSAAAAAEQKKRAEALRQQLVKKLACEQRARLNNADRNSPDWKNVYDVCMQEQ
jgi:hypothetical protein